jgi:DNA-binding protein H-NS
VKNNTKEASATFQSMAFDDLLRLREQLDQVIAERISAEEQELQDRLNLIKRFRHVVGSRDGAGTLAGRKLRPKYRNPDNPAQTWAGRGLQPKWLIQALKSGRKLESFRVKDEE